MNPDFSHFQLGFDEEWCHEVPSWFSKLTEFSYEVCSARNMSSESSEHFVISLPDIDGGFAAITLGILAAEVARIEKNSNFEEISLDALEVGMRISIDSGNMGQQRITGQVKTISLDDKIPRIEIGSRWIVAQFIKRIWRLPLEAGNPQIYEKKNENAVQPPCFLRHLAFSSLPIHRALVDIRSTSKIIEDEFEWKFFNHQDKTCFKVKDIVRPMRSGQTGSGWSIVLNSSESEEIAWSNLKSELTTSELESDISVLCSSAAILSQIDSVNSKIVFSILGRDDRQLATTELAIRQRYEYSSPLKRKINTEILGPSIELISFEVPLNV